MTLQDWLIGGSVLAVLLLTVLVVLVMLSECGWLWHWIKRKALGLPPDWPRHYKVLCRCRPVSLDEDQDRWDIIAWNYAWEHMLRCDPAGNPVDEKGVRKLSDALRLIDDPYWGEGAKRLLKRKDVPWR